jgi:hypothetical protein
MSNTPVRRSGRPPKRTRPYEELPLTEDDDVLPPAALPAAQGPTATPSTPHVHEFRTDLEGSRAKAAVLHAWIIANQVAGHRHVGVFQRLLQEESTLALLVRGVSDRIVEFAEHHHSSLEAGERVAAQMKAWIVSDTCKKFAINLLGSWKTFVRREVNAARVVADEQARALHRAETSAPSASRPRVPSRRYNRPSGAAFDAEAEASMADLGDVVPPLEEAVGRPVDLATELKDCLFPATVAWLKLDAEIAAPTSLSLGERYLVPGVPSTDQPGDEIWAEKLKAFDHHCSLLLPPFRKGDIPAHLTRYVLGYLVADAGVVIRDEAALEYLTPSDSNSGGQDSSRSSRTPVGAQLASVLTTLSEAIPLLTPRPSPVLEEAKKVLLDLVGSLDGPDLTEATKTKLRHLAFVLQGSVREVLARVIIDGAVPDRVMDEVLNVISASI